MLTLDDALNFLGQNIFDRVLNVALLSIAAYLLYRWVLEPAFTIVKGMLTFWRVRKSPAVFLEITPWSHGL